MKKNKKLDFETKYQVYRRKAKKDKKYKIVAKYYDKLVQIESFKDNIKEKIKDMNTSYKGEWEKQNKELDKNSVTINNLMKKNKELEEEVEKLREIVYDCGKDMSDFNKK